MGVGGHYALQCLHIFEDFRNKKSKKGIIKCGKAQRVGGDFEPHMGINQQKTQKP